MHAYLKLWQLYTELLTGEWATNTATDFQGQMEACINHVRLNIIEKGSFEFTITTAPYLDLLQLVNVIG